MSNIVLVPGSSHGGWYFEETAPGLEAAGHVVFTPTLTGLESADSPSSTVNLDTHIDDITSLIESEKLDDVVLVGHSYGGMVITGVAGRLANQVSHLIYMDAMVPEPGKRLWDALSPEMRDIFLSFAHDGYRIHPDPGFQQARPRAVPHPLATFLQPLTYDPAFLGGIEKTYVWSAENHGSPFGAIYQRLSARDDWKTIAVPYGHDLFVDAPEQMTNIILERIQAV